MNDDPIIGRSSLQWKLLGIITIALVAISAAYTVFVQYQTGKPLKESLSDKAVMLNRTVSFMVRGTREDALPLSLNRFTSDSDVAWIEIYRGDGSIAYQHTPVLPPAVAVAAFAAMEEDEIRASALDKAFEVWGRTLSVVIHEDGTTTELPYYVRTGISKEPIAAWKRKAVVSSLIFCIVATALVVGLLSILVFRLTHRLKDMVERATRISRGDLTRVVHDDTSDEVGTLGQAFNSMLQGLSGIVRHIQKTVTTMYESVEQLRNGSVALKEGAQLQKTELDQTRSAVGDLTQSLANVSVYSAAMEQSVSRIASSIHQMDSSIREMKKYFATLADHIGETANSISEMSGSISEVAQSAKTLRHVSEESTLATKTLADKTEEISRRALDTARISRDAQTAAEKGSEIIKKSIASGNEIFQTFTVVKDHTQTLDTELRKITEVVQVIEDLADRTNILSLNAAIIAAQAKEHGKGFMVVADEIKKLAGSTTDSLRVIETKVSSVLEKGVQVRKAVESGEERVKRGIALSDQMDRSLREILELLATVAETAQEISGLTKGQKESTDGVRYTIEQVERMAQTISQATGEQAQTAETIHASSEELRGVTEQGGRMISEEVEASRNITQGIEAIFQTIRNLEEARKQGMEKEAQIELAVERVEEIAVLSIENIDQITEKVSRLEELADMLKKQVARFQLQSGGDGDIVTPNPYSAAMDGLHAKPSTDARTASEFSAERADRATRPPSPIPRETLN